MDNRRSKPMKAFMDTQSQIAKTVYSEAAEPFLSTTATPGEAAKKILAVSRKMPPRQDLRSLVCGDVRYDDLTYDMHYGMLQAVFVRYAAEGDDEEKLCSWIKENGLIL